MKLLFITKNLYPVPSVKGGSIETLITSFINQNEIEQQAEITVASKFDPKALEESKNYKHTKFIYYDPINDNQFVLLYRILRYRFFGMFHVSVPKYVYSTQLYKHALNEDYDLIVIEEGDPFSFDIFSKKFGREKMVAHVHSSWPANEKFHSIYGSIITPCEYTKNALIAGKWDDYKENGYVAHNCIDGNLFQPKMSEEEKKEFKKSLGFQPDDFVIFFAGRISEDKGPLQLIQAMGQLTDCKLVIAGTVLHSTNVKDDYAKAVSLEASKHANVIETGDIKYDEISKYYDMCDLVVTPSYGKEPCCLVNLESMYMGKPLISSDDGGIPEYVIGDRNVLLMNVDHLVDEIVKNVRILKNDPELRDTLAKNNLEDCHKYSPKTYYQEMMDAFHKITKK